MKENNQIEDLFRKSFENHEHEYDSSQWDLLNKRLDNAGSSFNWKWIYGSIAFLLLTGLTTAFLYLNQSENKLDNDTNNTKSNKIEIVKTDTLLNKPSKKDTTSKTDLENTLKTKNENETLLTNSTESSINLKDENKEMEVLVDNGSSNKTNLIEEIEEKTNNTVETTQEDLGSVIPSIEDKCLNETIEIHNVNKDNLYVIFPNKSSITIASNQTEKIKLNIVGAYIIKTEDRIENLENSFMVNPLPEVSLHHAAELNYETGLPVLDCELICNERLITWNLDNEIVNQYQDAKQSELYIFGKGSHEIVVTTKNEFGCYKSSTSNFKSDEEYNLLAVNAFSPNSLDTRNQTFMPYALVIRNTPFTLNIYDPDDGGLVFETEDANFPWEGIDKRTGSMIPLNKAYIWRVSLKSPKKGEMPIYKGTIVRF